MGQDVTYTLTASNQGPDDEPDAVVTCPLPSDVVFCLGELRGGLVSHAGARRVDGQPRAAGVGASAVVTVVLVPQAAAAGTLTTSFTIQGQQRGSGAVEQHGGCDR